MTDSFDTWQDFGKYCSIFTLIIGSTWCSPQSRHLFFVESSEAASSMTIIRRCLAYVRSLLVLVVIAVWQLSLMFLHWDSPKNFRFVVEPQGCWQVWMTKSWGVVLIQWHVKSLMAKLQAGRSHWHWKAQRQQVWQKLLSSMLNFSQIVLTFHFYLL